MEKKTISVHAFTVHIYTIAIVVLLLLLAVLGIKYMHLKLSVQKYTQSTIWMNAQEKPTGQISEYGLIVAQSVSEVPPADLQNYVTNLSKILNRDIVILDKNQKVLSDTVSANKGTTYGYDTNGEIKATLTDGKVRLFEEKSADYPKGLAELVVPITNANQITGAVLISNTQVTR